MCLCLLIHFFHPHNKYSAPTEPVAQLLCKVPGMCENNVAPVCMELTEKPMCLHVCMYVCVCVCMHISMHMVDTYY